MGEKLGVEKLARDLERATEDMRRGVAKEPEELSRKERDRRVAIAREIMDEAGVHWRELRDQLTHDVMRKITGLGYLDDLAYGVVVTALRFVVAFPVDFRYFVHYEYQYKRGGDEANSGD